MTGLTFSFLLRSLFHKQPRLVGIVDEMLYNIIGEQLLSYLWFNKYIAIQFDTKIAILYYFLNKIVQDSGATIL
ncbi:MAG: hypothetical protein MUO88_03810 [Desulfobacterales bacterium]|nr:hypothetical protein [Desulfobacterales bacterium]